MNIIITDQSVEWERAGHHVRINGSSLHQALFCSQSDIVVVLSGNDTEPKIISLYDLDGRKLRDIHEPENCHFNYIGEYPGHEIAVMTMSYISGWTDWWYALELKTGELKSLGEGR